MNRAAGGDAVVRVDPRPLLADPEFRGELEALAGARGEPLPGLESYARECLRELTVEPRERWLAATVRLARFMLTRSYAPDIDVNADRLAALRELGGKRPLIFLWSHKSHLDSFAFLKVVHDAGFRPQPLSFAGINMAFAGFDTLARRSGAIFLRRSFADDPVYRLVLRAYLGLLVRADAPLSWSIEGTRSRTGKLMPPKLGLLRWVAEACESEGRDDALIVPVSISFDQIAEIGDYVAMQQGRPKRRESLRWFVDYVRGMKEPAGRIYVRFAEPLRLDERFDLPEFLPLDDPGPGDRTRDLAFEVCRRIERATPVNGTALACLLLLGSGGAALNFETLLEHAQTILDACARLGAPRTSALDEPERALREALRGLRRSRVVLAGGAAGREAFRVAPAQELAAGYYANTVAHFFLAEAVAELCVADHAPDATADTADPVAAAALEFRDLLKFAYFFPARSEFLRRVTGWLDLRFEGWRGDDGRAAADPLAARPPLLGQALLRAPIEAGRVVGEWRVRRAPERAGDADAATGCLALGRELREAGLIASGHGLSLPVLESMLRAAELEPDPAQFLRRAQRAQAALDRLQQAFDAALAGD